MESVEQRRSRLAAMREQAASQTEDVAPSSSPSLGDRPLLANPLEHSADVATAEGNGFSRFDFYTDPLAAFQSSTKLRRPAARVPAVQSQAAHSSNATPQIGVGILPPPSHLPPASVYPPQGPSIWQPIAYEPLAYHNPTFAQPKHSQLDPQGPHPDMTQFSNEPSGRGRDRVRHGGRYDNERKSRTGPAGRRDMSARGFPPSSSGAERGYDSRHNPGGRGDHWSGRSSPGDQSWRGNRSEGRGGHGRGRGGGRIVSAKDQPHLFAKETMLEDPWQSLQARGVESS